MGHQLALFPDVEELVNGKSGFIIEVSVQVADAGVFGFRQALL